MINNTWPAATTHLLPTPVENEGAISLPYLRKTPVLLFPQVQHGAILFTSHYACRQFLFLSHCFFFNLICKVASEGRLQHSLSALVRTKRMQIGGSMRRLSENNSQLEEGYAICQTKGLCRNRVVLSKNTNVGCVLNYLRHKGEFTPRISANI